MKFTFGLLTGLVVGWYFGWGAAHLMVAEECKKLGKFFVKDEVFECVKVSEKKGNKI